MSTSDPQTAGNAWDAAAAGWDRHGPLVRTWLQDASAAMLDAAGIRAGARVLDVAAGAGDQTLDIARRVGPTGEVHATDLSVAILERAAQRLAKARADGEPLAPVSTQVADAQSLALSGRGFDAAICRLGLMFCADPGAALRSVHAALAPGGRFAALVFAGPSGNPCITTLVRTALEHVGAPPGDPFAPGTLLSLGRPDHVRALMSEAGFDDISVQALDTPMCTASAAEYVQFVRDAGAPVIQLLNALPPARRDAAWAEITQRLARFQEGRGWVGPNQLLLVAGAKARHETSPGRFAA